MNLLNLLFGSILLVLFIIKSASHKKYDSYYENLDSGEYPLRGIYCVGFSWNNSKLLSLKGEVKERLVKEAKLLYDPQFAEYYSTISWVQALSFIHLSLTFGFILSALADSVLFDFVGIFFAVFCGYYFLTRMKTKVDERESACNSELPEMVSTMALLIGSGMVLREAWEKVATAKEGVLYDLMLQSIVEMNNGVSEVEAIHKFGVLSNSGEIKKFTSLLIQSIEKGGSELRDFLVTQASEMWEENKQYMLQKGEAAATKLLAPIALIFAGMMLIIIAGAIGLLI